MTFSERFTMGTVYCLFCGSRMSAEMREDHMRTVHADLSTQLIAKVMGR